jgi:hypothetical protein
MDLGVLASTAVYLTPTSGQAVDGDGVVTMVSLRTPSYDQRQHVENPANIDPPPANIVGA